MWRWAGYAATISVGILGGVWIRLTHAVSAVPSGKLPFGYFSRNGTNHSMSTQSSYAAVSGAPTM